MSSNLSAREMIVKVRINFLREHPFFANVAMYLDLVEDKHLPTIGVNAEGELRFNPDFVNKYNFRDLKMIIAHETLHLALLHLVRVGNRDKLIWNFACFTPNMTLSGDFIPIENVTEKNKVISRYGNVDNIKAISKREYSGDIYKIKAIGIKEIEATPKHPFLILKRKNIGQNPIKFENDLSWIKAKDLNESCYLVVPKIKGTIKTEKLDLKKYAKEMHRYGHNIKNKEIILNNDTAWLMGLYVAEGSSGGKGSLKMSLGFNDKKYLDKIYEINKNNLKTKIQKVEIPEKKVISLTLSSSLLERAFKDWFGKGAKNKEIPDFILYNENIEIVKHFLEGYVNGDGCKYKKGNSEITKIGTASEKLALQIQALLTRLNIFSCYHKTERKERTLNNQKLPKQILYEIEWRSFRTIKRTLNGKIIDSHSYSWRDMGDYFATPIKKIYKKEYNGFVYNMETETHTYAINNVATHNCDIAINNMLEEQGFHVPNEFLKKYEYRKMSAEEIYDILIQKAKKIKVSSGSMLSDGKGFGVNGERFDTHSYPKMQNGNGDKKNKAHEDPNGKPMSSNDLNRLKDEWKRRVVEAETIAHQMGKMPSELERLFGKIIDSKINWKALLYRYITQEIPCDSTYARPSKRSESVGFYMPYTVKENIDITVAIDSSGSITEEDMTDFMSEVIAIAKSFASIKMTVIVCDAEIHSTHEISNGFSVKDIKLSGGGGTDATPIVKWIEKNKPSTKLWIYLTDGFTQLRGENPFKALWLIHRNGSMTEAENIAKKAGNITCISMSE